MKNDPQSPVPPLDTIMSQMFKKSSAGDPSNELFCPQIGDQYIPPSGGDKTTFERPERKPGYNSWAAMKQRCKNPKHKDYPNYGGKGISYCAEWETFSQFISDMGVPPSADATLDRIDNAGDYSPQNCRWADKTEQARNRVTNRQITFNDHTYPLAQWAALYEMKPATLSERINAGWSIEEALKIPVNRGGDRRQARIVSSRSGGGGPWPPSLKAVELCENLYQRRSSDDKEMSRAEFFLLKTQYLWKHLSEEQSGCDPDYISDEDKDQAKRLDVMRREAREIIKQSKKNF